MRLAGVMISEIPFSNFPVLFKSGGLDFLILDCEHGGFNFTDVSKILMTAKLCGMLAIVRIPDNGRRDIIKFMDMGAGGLLLPMTNRAEDIGRVVEYAKYAPLGKRGISTMRAHTMYAPSSLTEYMVRANSETKIFAQIETAEGVRNLEEICSVPGVAGCLVGPNDLSCDYGCLTDQQSEKIADVIRKVAESAQGKGKQSGIITSNEYYLRTAKEAKMDYFCVGSELSMLKQGAVKTVKTIQQP